MGAAHTIHLIRVLALARVGATPPFSCITALREAVASRANILVAGGTSTGKTTLTNALLAEVA